MSSNIGEVGEPIDRRIPPREGADADEVQLQIQLFEDHGLEPDPGSADRAAFDPEASIESERNYEEAEASEAAFVELIQATTTEEILAQQPAAREASDSSDEISNLPVPLPNPAAEGGQEIAATDEISATPITLPKEDPDGVPDPTSEVSATPITLPKEDPDGVPDPTSEVSATPITLPKEDPDGVPDPTSEVSATPITLPKEGPGDQVSSLPHPLAGEASQAAAEQLGELTPDAKNENDRITINLDGSYDGGLDLDNGVEQVVDLHQDNQIKDQYGRTGDARNESVGYVGGDVGEGIVPGDGDPSALDILTGGGDTGIPGFDGEIYQDGGGGNEGAPFDPEKDNRMGEILGDEFGIFRGASGGPPGQEIEDLPGEGEMEGWNDRPDLRGAAAPGADPRIGEDGKDDPPPPPPPPEEEDPPAPPPPPKEKKGPKLVDKMPEGSQRRQTGKMVAGRIWKGFNDIFGTSGEGGDSGFDDATGGRGTPDPEGAAPMHGEIPPGPEADPMDAPLNYGASMMQPVGEDSDREKPREDLKAEMSGSDVDPYAQYHGDEVDVPQGSMGGQVDVDSNLIDKPKPDTGVGGSEQGLEDSDASDRERAD